MRAISTSLEAPDVTCSRSSGMTASACRSTPNVWSAVVSTRLRIRPALDVCEPVWAEKTASIASLHRSRCCRTNGRDSHALCSDGAIRFKSLQVPRRRGLAVRAAPELDRNQPVAIKRRTELQGQILEQLPVVHRNNHLTPRLFQRP